MKKVLIVHSTMEIGGAETSLISLLQTIDYKRYDVTLFLLRPVGELMPLIPPNVHILHYTKYEHLLMPIKDVFRIGDFGLGFSRLLGKIRGRKYSTPCYAVKQFAHNYAMAFLPKIEGVFDAAISFIDPHFIVQTKVIANLKIAWFHTNYSRVETNKNLDKKMWSNYDYIVNVSDACKQAFDSVYPEFVDKSIVIENILSPDYIKKQIEIGCVEDMPYYGESTLTILSIGRFVDAKNFSNIPHICYMLKQKEIIVKWYIIGYGGEEAKIRENIKKYHVEDCVIILGKKTNPYPYIKNCDIYVQPSLYEGKCVAVREAQIVGKPVLITNYSSARSQVKNGIDGIICGMNNEDIVNSIAEYSTEKQETITKYLKCHVYDYTNEAEIQKLYQLII